MARHLKWFRFVDLDDIWRAFDNVELADTIPVVSTEQLRRKGRMWPHETMH